MQIRATASGCEVWTPAKLNLFLEVLAKRSDGYHEIETLMCPVAVYDTLSFRPEPSGNVTLQCVRMDDVWRTPQAASLDDPLPAGGDNTVVRAVELHRQRAGIEQGCSLSLVKRIPVAAGMAGGSSDAAAALVAANCGWRAGLPFEVLNGLATEIGSDVPFFLGRGPAVCRGRGERIEPLTGLNQLHFVIVKPPTGLSTAEVYKACRPAAAPESMQTLLAAWREGRLNDVGRALHNRLQPAAESLSPWIERLRREFAGTDCLGHQMSGSGTSYFGLCRHARQARRIASQLAARNLGWVRAVSSCL